MTLPISARTPPRLLPVGLLAVPSEPSSPIGLSPRWVAGLALVLAGLTLLAACGDDSPSQPADTGCTDPFFCPDAGGDVGDTGVDGDADTGGCQDDEACPEGEYCRLDTGRCRAGCRTAPNTCTGDCRVCDAATHVCVDDLDCLLGCESDGDCGDDQYCEPTVSRCRAGCRVDAPACPDTDLAYCCSAGLVCDPDSHDCQGAPCEGDADCSDLQFCSQSGGNGECLGGCRTDPDNCPTVWLAGDTTECDPTRRTCTQINCQGDDSRCPLGTVCEVTTCRPGCRSDEECGAQPCNPLSRRCECAEDDDCEEGSICQSRQCLPRCTLNSSCPGSRPYCNAVTGRCFSTCANESGEPNNQRSTAVVLGNATSFGGVLCGVDEDWFRLEGLAGESVRYAFGFDPGTLTVTLRGPGGVELTSVTQTSEDGSTILSIQAQLAEDGPLYAQITGAGVSNSDTGQQSLGYFAQITRTPADACLEDDLEDDDTFATASPLDEGELTAQSLCADDTFGDLFTLSLPPDRRAEVTITFDDSAGNLDLIVYDSTRLLVEQVDSGTGTEFVTIGPHVAQTSWFVAVVGHQPGVDEALYTLAYSLVEVTGCTPDDHEDDDTSGTATVSGAVFDNPAEFVDRSACAGDPDWYSVSALAGSDIRARVVQASPTRTLRIEIIPPDLGPALASVENNTLDRTVEATDVASAGTHYVRIQDVGGDEGTDGVVYELTIELIAPQCDDDDFEEDDDSASGTTIIGDGEPTTFDSDTHVSPPGPLRVCQSDDDFFRVVMDRSGTLQATLTALDWAESLQLDLLDVNEVFIANALSASDTELALAERVLAAGTYFLRLEPSGFIPLAGQLYSLEATATLDPVECIDTGLEPNDSAEEPALITQGQSGQRVCPGNDDYYLVSVVGTNRVTVDYAFADETPNVTVALSDLADTNNSDSADGGLTGSVSLDMADSGELLLAVTQTEGQSVPEEGAAYSFGLTVEPIALCEPSDHDSPELAEGLAMGALEPGRVCDGSELWFLIQLAQGGQHTITLQKQATEVLGLEVYAFGNTDTLGCNEGEDAEACATTDTGDAVIVSNPAGLGLAGLHFLRVLQSEPLPLDGVPFTLSFTTVLEPVCDDFLEPNNSSGTASQVVGTVDETLFVCPEDVDWFTFEVTGGSPRDVTITLDQLGTPAPWNVRLENSLGGEVHDMTNADDPRVIAESLVPDSYLLRVGEGDATAPAEGIGYTLDIALDVLVCTDFLEASEPVSVAVDLPTSWDNLKACDGDVDLFTFEVTKDGTDLLEARVDRAAPSAEMTVRLYDGGGTLASQPGLDDDTSFTLTANDLAPGTYFIEVAVTTPPAGGEVYDLTIDVAAPCTDDYEPNENDGQAALLATPTGFANGRVCPGGDEDWFVVSPSLGPVDLDATVTTPGGGSVTLDLFVDPTGDPVETGSPISQPGLAAGDYYLRVTSSSTDEHGVAYNLTVTTPLSGCPRDRLEDNDDPALDPLTAAPGFTGEPLYLCDADDDYFPVTVTSAAEHINVVIQHDTVAENVLVEILRITDPDPDTFTTELVSSSDDTLPFRTLWAFNPGAGDYLVHVVASNPPGLGVAYEIQTTVTTTTGCPDDDYEGAGGNDGFETAQPPRAAVDGANLCPGDEDWYLLDLRNTLGDILFGVDFATSQSFILDLYDTDGETLLVACTTDGCNGGLETPQTASFDDTAQSALWFAEDLPGGTYFARVTASGVDETGLDYQLTTRIDALGCPWDAFEPNDTLDDAVEPRNGETLLFDFVASLCPGTVNSESDFYALPLETPGSIVVSVAPAPLTGSDPTIDVLLYPPDPATDPLDNPFDVDAAAGIYRAEVLMDSPPDSDGQGYELAWSTGPACQDDGSEPNDDFDSLTPTATPHDDNALVLCGDNADYFEYLTPSGGDSDVHVDLFFVDPSIDAEIALFTGAPPPTFQVEDNDPASPPMTLTLRGVAADTPVFLRVQKTPGAATPDREPYILSVDIIDACPDDGNEPNDTLDDGPTMLDVGATETVSGWACRADVDLYETSLSAGTYTIAVDQDPDNQGTLQVDLFELVGGTTLVPLGGSVSSTDQTLQLEVDDATVLISQVGGTNTRIDYDITVTSVP